MGDQQQDFWAITTYFNPAGYARRLENFRRFRQALTMPLIAVEFAIDRGFALQKHDAEVLVQVSDGDVMWQKERMLNVALGHLPRECRYVVCLDCDLIFGGDDWSQSARTILERVSMVQPFRMVHHLYPTAKSITPDQAFVHAPGLAARVADGFSAEECLSWAMNHPHEPVAPGGALAFRREILEAHGWYDACIVGGGDMSIMAAAYGCFEHPMRAMLMNAKQRAHYLAWARPFYESVRGSLGFVEVDVYHLWHGKLADRRYMQRYHGFSEFGFDPGADLRISAEDIWRWNSEKPELHAYLKKYFAQREEDFLP
jgi:hypothetical protein